MLAVVLSWWTVIETMKKAGRIRHDPKGLRRLQKAACPPLPLLFSPRDSQEREGMRKQSANHGGPSQITNAMQVVYFQGAAGGILDVFRRQDDIPLFVKSVK